MTILDKITLFAQGRLGDPEDIGIPNQTLGDGAVINMLNLLYGIVGIVAVIVLIIAGLNYVTSSGDANKVTKAKNMIMYTVIGLVVVFGAYVMTNFVISEAS